ncbi:MAG: ATP-dependent DNA helicase RecG [Bacteroidales bacterium]|nr:ATP-dependent DNA helicase RecG [Bacteroidales bacterium]
MDISKSDSTTGKGDARDFLETGIQYLKGVGPKRAELLGKELNIFTFRDLLYFFPYKYIDRSRFYTIAEIDTSLAFIQLKGRITGLRTEGAKYKQRLIARFTDDTGAMELVWFQGILWAAKNIETGKEYIVFGRPSIFNGRISIAHPEIDTVEKSAFTFSGKLQPQYSSTEKLKNSFITSKTIQKLIAGLFQQMTQMDETLPGYLISKLKFPALYDALFAMHFPADQGQLKKATYRLKFEELFYIQLNILRQKNRNQQDIKGHVFAKVGSYVNDFYHKKLTFELTEAQKRVIREIRKDLGSGKQMNRLLQGDVGSGKTLVAVMAMLIALDNGYQACLMAPTEILANQHFATISGFLEGLSVNVRLLTGSTRKTERNKLFAELSNGDLKILIGTHALLEDPVQFKNLGLVIIDEQHRFGVAQRARLRQKNENPPHVLVMTATPIPRTLAMTLYGDLDVSVIDEMPPGRKPIKTVHYTDSKRLVMFGFLREQIKQRRQVYVVYPLISESEKLDYKALDDGYEAMTRAFPPPQYLVVCVHGRLKAEEKDMAMQYFQSGKAHIMVATTVIEVGVDIPNASVMVIESAERFGLSQLHQLRGRVGRGADQSYCILMTSHKQTTEARKRIETMVNTTDGFVIAEVDLKLRGPGDIEGTQQSGIPFDLKIASLSEDGQIIQFARDTAQEILNRDNDLSSPHNEILLRQLKKLSRSQVDWSSIS